MEGGLGGFISLAMGFEPGSPAAPSVPSAPRYLIKWKKRYFLPSFRLDNCSCQTGLQPGISTRTECFYGYRISQYVQTSCLMLPTAPVAWLGLRCTAGHSGSGIVVAPSPESSGTGSAHDVPSGRSLHPLSKFSPVFFSGREALPLGRRTSRCHRRVSHSAARP